MNPQEYDKYLAEKRPKTPMVRNVIWAFFVGGAICLLGQLINAVIADIFPTLTIEATASWTSIVLIAIGAILTAFGVYDKIAKNAGAGTLVPITGFANAIVSSAIEFKSEGFIAGLGGKIFSIAGPVIVYGTIASVIVGVLHYYLFY